MEGLLPVKIGAVQQLPDRFEGEAAGAEQQNLLQAIHVVLEGGTYVDSTIQAQILGFGRAMVGKRTEGASPALTEREQYVLRLIAFGKTNKEIALQLGVGVKTVETFKARACSKLELRTRAQIVRFAVAQGWFGDA